MKRSEINSAVLASISYFEHNKWALPPNPKWDITDFGLGNFKKSGLVLLNLAEEPEYCEKLMYAIKGQITPAHYHRQKKEDIICRTGELVIHFWSGQPYDENEGGTFEIKINGEVKTLSEGSSITLAAGERVTILPGIWHEFYPDSDECIIGEVSTANDDLNDNFFFNKDIGRFSQVIEDEEKRY